MDKEEVLSEISIISKYFNEIDDCNKIMTKNRSKSFSNTLSDLITISNTSKESNELSLIKLKDFSIRKQRRHDEIIPNDYISNPISVQNNQNVPSTKHVSLSDHLYQSTMQFCPTNKTHSFLMSENVKETKNREDSAKFFFFDSLENIQRSLREKQNEKNSGILSRERKTVETTDKNFVNSDDKSLRTSFSENMKFSKFEESVISKDFAVNFTNSIDQNSLGHFYDRRIISLCDNKLNNITHINQSSTPIKELNQSELPDIEFHQSFLSKFDLFERKEKLKSSIGNFSKFFSYENSLISFNDFSVRKSRKFLFYSLISAILLVGLSSILFYFISRSKRNYKHFNMKQIFNKQSFNEIFLNYDLNVNDCGRIDCLPFTQFIKNESQFKLISSKNYCESIGCEYDEKEIPRIPSCYVKMKRVEKKRKINEFDNLINFQMITNEIGMMEIIDQYRNDNEQIKDIYNITQLYNNQKLKKKGNIDFDRKNLILKSNGRKLLEVRDIMMNENEKRISIQIQNNTKVLLPSDKFRGSKDFWYWTSIISKRRFLKNGENFLFFPLIYFVEINGNCYGYLLDTLSDIEIFFTPVPNLINIRWMFGRLKIYCLSGSSINDVLRQYRSFFDEIRLPLSLLEEEIHQLTNSVNDGISMTDKRELFDGMKFLLNLSENKLRNEIDLKDNGLIKWLKYTSPYFFLYRTNVVYSYDSVAQKYIHHIDYTSQSFQKRLNDHFPKLISQTNNKSDKFIGIYFHNNNQLKREECFENFYDNQEKQFSFIHQQSHQYSSLCNIVQHENGNIHYYSKYFNSLSKCQQLGKIIKKNQFLVMDETVIGCQISSIFLMNKNHFHFSENCLNDLEVIHHFILQYNFFASSLLGANIDICSILINNDGNCFQKCLLLLFSLPLMVIDESGPISPYNLHDIQEILKIRRAFSKYFQSAIIDMKRNHQLYQWDETFLDYFSSESSFHIGRHLSINLNNSPTNQLKDYYSLKKIFLVNQLDLDMGYNLNFLQNIFIRKRSIILLNIGNNLSLFILPNERGDARTIHYLNDDIDEEIGIKISFNNNSKLSWKCSLKSNKNIFINSIQFVNIPHQPKFIMITSSSSNISRNHNSNSNIHYDTESKFLIVDNLNLDLTATTQLSLQ
ncbi:hypothetical protein SNEBB_001583 [Seison nebaliae]|nr:hypothetical protein SNEBB_001583 [Seison nebaliae]